MGSGTIFDATTFEDAKRRQAGDMQKIAREPERFLHHCHRGKLSSDNRTEVRSTH
jgi:hypothetical protein